MITNFQYAFYMEKWTNENGKRKCCVCVFLNDFFKKFTTSALKYMYLYENFNLVQVLYQRVSITTETDMRWTVEMPS